MRFMTYLFALFVSLCAWPVTAAVLETEITPAMAEMGCTARLSGEVVAGDLERIRPYLATDLSLSGLAYPGAEDDISWRNFSPAVYLGIPGMFVHRLCLNSPGGSLTEAMRIANFVRSHEKTGIPTAVTRGDTCESACAFIFFSGRFVYSAGDTNYEDDTDFILHPMGHLGLHAPFLPFDKAMYSNRQIREIWRVGMESVAMIARNITNGTVRMSRDLFTEMLTYPADRMLYIETVGQVVRWNIDVEPSPLDYGIFPGSPDDQFDALCRNALNMAPVFLDMQFNGTRVARVRSDGIVAMSETLFTDQKTGTRYACEVKEEDLQQQDPTTYVEPARPWNNGGQAGIRVGFSGSCANCEFEVTLSEIAIFAPETRLSDIAPPPQQR